MPTYLERFLNGECEQVWTELSILGDSINTGPIFEDALDVTRETMIRVRNNIDLIITRLNSVGYIFGYYPDGERLEGYTKPHNPPPGNISSKISRFESLKGIESFPLSIKIFWEIVGEINLSGRHVSWPQFSDPLIVFPVNAIEATYSEWCVQIKEEDAEAGEYEVPLAPDFYHKDNVSGGSPYSIRVPSFSIDGNLENERNQTTFVNYLRICFRYGGFPGFKWIPGPIPEEINNLAKNLAPI